MRAPPNGYVGFNLLSQLIAAVIMIPATFCAGMTLPLLTHELLRRGTGERAIGTIYSANTLGAIVGVLLTINVLMPLIGVKGVILGGAAIHIALGLTRLLDRPPPSAARPAGRDRRSVSAVFAVRRVRREIGSAADDLRGVPHRIRDAAARARRSRISRTARPPPSAWWRRTGR